jgi:hypothetical protein
MSSPTLTLVLNLAATIPVFLIAATAARRRRFGITAIVFALGIFVGWPWIGLPAHGLACLLMLITTLICWALGTSPNRLCQSAAALAMGAFLFHGGLYVVEIREREELRTEYPFESVSDRLAYERRGIPIRFASAAPTATPSVQPSRDTVEGPSGLGDVFRLAELPLTRTVMLRRLHEGTVRNFISSPGFGVGRRIEPDRNFLKLPRDPGRIPLPPPQYVPDVEWEANEAGKERAFRPGLAQGPSSTDLQSMHLSVESEFATEEDFGYVKDRDHVAGFRPHYFRFLPDLPNTEKRSDRWLVQNLELVSLIKFGGPVVYLSQHLPRMDELRDAKTRPLNQFEAKSLEGLYQGEDLLVRARPDWIRVLGSIRARKACSECHNVEAGDLLGAFSYVLRRDGSP